MPLAYNTGKYVCVVCMYIHIYEQKFIMAEIMRMRMFMCAFNFCLS